jgi:hypothetical protein
MIEEETSKEISDLKEQIKDLKHQYDKAKTLAAAAGLEG